MKFVFCAVMIAVVVIGCKHDDCDPQSTRCDGEVVEVCNTEKDWEESEDCTSVSVGGLVFKCEVGELGDHECVYKGGEIFDTAFDTEFYDGGIDASW